MRGHAVGAYVHTILSCGGVTSQKNKFLTNNIVVFPVCSPLSFIDKGFHFVRRNNIASNRRRTHYTQSSSFFILCLFFFFSSRQRGATPRAFVMSDSCYLYVKKKKKLYTFY